MDDATQQFLWGVGLAALGLFLAFKVHFGFVLLAIFGGAMAIMAMTDWKR